MPETATETIDRLRALYDEMESMIGGDRPIDVTVPEVSDWSSAQHLYHVLGATSMMLKAATLLAKGAVDGDEPGLTKAGRTILKSEMIPRGVAQAPEKTVPPASLDRDALAESFARSAGKLNTAVLAMEDRVSEDRGLPHPAWGVLTAPQWLRAATIHIQHHLNIIHEIQETHA